MLHSLVNFGVKIQIFDTATQTEKNVVVIQNSKRNRCIQNREKK